MQTDVNHMNYAAVCACGVVRGSVRIDRRNLKVIGKQVTNWIRSGYLVKLSTDSYVRDHSGACRCQEAEAS